jgi:hypothetical protein
MSGCFRQSKSTRHDHVLEALCCPAADSASSHVGYCLGNTHLGSKSHHGKLRASRMHSDLQFWTLRTHDSVSELDCFSKSRIQQ